MEHKDWLKIVSERKKMNIEEIRKYLPMVSLSSGR